jgi:hypothetical protein
MAISTTHYLIIRDLFLHGLLPRGAAVLEVGEANWYDLDSLALVDDVKKFVRDPLRAEALINRLHELVGTKPAGYLFGIAKVFYEVFFAPTEMQSIDFNGTSRSLGLDLNAPIMLNRKFDVSINHGTAEHIFNIAQVFMTMHEYTIPGGMMIHESPFTGWIEHGFYNLQPTLFFDLCEFNRYAMYGMFVQDLTTRTVLQIQTREDVYQLTKDKKLPDNSMLLTILRKHAEDRPFQIPIQGYYRKALPSTGIEAWRNLR